MSCSACKLDTAIANLTIAGRHRLALCGDCYPHVKCVVPTSDPAVVTERRTNDKNKWPDHVHLHKDSALFATVHVIAAILGDDFAYVMDVPHNDIEKYSSGSERPDHYKIPGHIVRPIAVGLGLIGANGSDDEDEGSDDEDEGSDDEDEGSDEVDMIVDSGPVASSSSGPVASSSSGPVASSSSGPVASSSSSGRGTKRRGDDDDDYYPIVPRQDSGDEPQPSTFDIDTLRRKHRAKLEMMRRKSKQVISQTMPRPSTFYIDVLRRKQRAKLERMRRKSKQVISQTMPRRRRPTVDELSKITPEQLSTMTVAEIEKISGINVIPIWTNMLKARADAMRIITTTPLKPTDDRLARLITSTEGFEYAFMQVIDLRTFARLVMSVAAKDVSISPTLTQITPIKTSEGILLPVRPYDVTQRSLISLSMIRPYMLCNVLGNTRSADLDEYYNLIRGTETKGNILRGLIARFIKHNRYDLLDVLLSFYDQDYSSAMTNPGVLLAGNLEPDNKEFIVSYFDSAYITIQVSLKATNDDYLAATTDLARSAILARVRNMTFYMYKPLIPVMSDNSMAFFGRSFITRWNPAVTQSLIADYAPAVLTAIVDSIANRYDISRWNWGDLSWLLYILIVRSENNTLAAAIPALCDAFVTRRDRLINNDMWGNISDTTKLIVYLYNNGGVTDAKVKYEASVAIIKWLSYIEFINAGGTMRLMQYFVRSDSLYNPLTVAVGAMAGSQNDRMDLLLHRNDEQYSMMNALIDGFRAVLNRYADRLTSNGRRMLEKALTKATNELSEKSTGRDELEKQIKTLKNVINETRDEDLRETYYSKLESYINERDIITRHEQYRDYYAGLLSKYYSKLDICNDFFNLLMPSSRAVPLFMELVQKDAVSLVSATEALFKLYDKLYKIESNTDVNDASVPVVYTLYTKAILALLGFIGSEDLVSARTKDPMLDREIGLAAASDIIRCINKPLGILLPAKYRLASRLKRQNYKGVEQTSVQTLMDYTLYFYNNSGLFDMQMSCLTILEKFSALGTVRNPATVFFDELCKSATIYHNVVEKALTATVIEKIEAEFNNDTETANIVVSALSILAHNIWYFADMWNHVQEETVKEYKIYAAEKLFMIIGRLPASIIRHIFSLSSLSSNTPKLDHIGAIAFAMMRTYGKERIDDEIINMLEFLVTDRNDLIIMIIADGIYKRGLDHVSNYLHTVLLPKYTDLIRQTIIRSVTGVYALADNSYKVTAFEQAGITLAPQDYIADLNEVRDFFNLYKGDSESLFGIARLVFGNNVVDKMPGDKVKYKVVVNDAIVWTKIFALFMAGAGNMSAFYGRSFRDMNEYLDMPEPNRMIPYKFDAVNFPIDATPDELAQMPLIVLTRDASKYIQAFYNANDKDISATNAKAISMLVRYYMDIKDSKHSEPIIALTKRLNLSPVASLRQYDTVSGSKYPVADLYDSSWLSAMIRTGAASHVASENAPAHMLALYYNMCTADLVKIEQYTNLQFQAGARTTLPDKFFLYYFSVMSEYYKNNYRPMVPVVFPDYFNPVKTLSNDTDGITHFAPNATAIAILTHSGIFSYHPTAHEWHEADFGTWLVKTKDSYFVSEVMQEWYSILYEIISRNNLLSNEDVLYAMISSYNSVLMLSLMLKRNEIDYDNHIFTQMLQRNSYAHPQLKFALHFIIDHVASMVLLSQSKSNKNTLMPFSSEQLKRLRDIIMTYLSMEKTPAEVFARQSPYHNGQTIMHLWLKSFLGLSTITDVKTRNVEDDTTLIDLCKQRNPEALLLLDYDGKNLQDVLLNINKGKFTGTLMTKRYNAIADLLKTLVFPEYNAGQIVRASVPTLPTITVAKSSASAPSSSSSIIPLPTLTTAAASSVPVPSSSSNADVEMDDVTSSSSAPASKSSLSFSSSSSKP